MSLLEALINQGNSKEEALEIIQEMKEQVNQGEDPEEVLFENGLEPDYFFDLI